MNIKRIIFTSVLAFTAAGAFMGCAKKQPKKTINPENTLTLELNKSEESAIVPETEKGLSSQKWHITNKRILVLFGYDFNDSETTNSLLYILKNEFGLDADGGLIYPLIFPDSFKHGTKTYVSDFKEVLKSSFKDTDLIGLVLLGAPEKTHIILENLQDENELYYPVFALFPQDDDTFGLEATCDLIVDKQQVEGTALPVEEGISQLIKEAPEVLVNSIKALISMDDMKISYSDIEMDGEAREAILKHAFPTDETMLQHVARILKGHSFKNYKDQDTGISAFNHFVIN